MKHILDQLADLMAKRRHWEHPSVKKDPMVDEHGAPDRENPSTAHMSLESVHDKLCPECQTKVHNHMVASKGSSPDLTESD